MNPLRGELVAEHYFRVSSYDVWAWGDVLMPGPTEIHIRMEVPRAPGIVILELRTPAEADQLISEIAQLRAIVWPKESIRR